MNDVICIYHKNCMDGLGAAYAVWTKHPDAEFIPMQYGEESPDVTGKNVFIVDFSFKRGVILAMREKAKRVVVIDHHKTAQAELDGLEDCVFNMEKSGCVLAWEYFYPEIPAPYALRLIQDRDLWKFQYTESKAFHAYLSSRSDLTPQALDWYIFDSVTQVEPSLSQVIDAGKAILRYQEQKVREVAKGAMKCTEKTNLTGLKGQKYILVNAPYHMASDLGDYLKDGVAYVAIYSLGEGNEVSISLRSSPEGADVSEIARLNGGGGHNHAAGYVISTIRLLEVLKNIYADMD